MYLTFCWNGWNDQYLGEQRQPAKPLEHFVSAEMCIKRKRFSKSPEIQVDCFKSLYWES